MIYVFSNIIGSFVLDEKMKIIDSVLFKNIEDYQNKEKTEQKLANKHKVKEVPKEKLLAVLSIFKDKKYFSAFHQQNMDLTKQALKSSVNEDYLIIQAIANVTELDKVTNLLTKRLREWYSLYFPELSKRISHNDAFVELIVSKSKTELMKELKLEQSMGSELAKMHLEEINNLAEETHRLYNLREMHEAYLEKVMKKYCPNLLELAGVGIGAKLIELGKGLKHLALLPASTLQLLGAEKALFRHLKTKSRSPKHGIIINHPFVQKAERKNKGKAARMLADKLSLCARLDYFKGEFKGEEYRKELEAKFK